MSNFILKTLETRELKLNTIRLRGFYGGKLRKGSGGGGSGDGFPQLPGDVTRWHFGGLTNEMMAAMDDPRIEDADGKGRFLSFKNFAWGGMSGVGGYVENYNRWTKSAVRADITFTDHSFNVTSVKINQAQFYYQSSGGEQPFTVPSGTVIVKGLTDGQVLEYIYTDIEGRHVFTVKNDGIYTLPSFEFIAKGAYYGFQFNKVQESCNITIEQLPLYPGFILGDGVDDFAVTEEDFNFEKEFCVYLAAIFFPQDSPHNDAVLGKDSNKDIRVLQYNNNLTFNSGNHTYCPVNLGQFSIVAFKRKDDTLLAKNLTTGVSNSVKATSGVLENPDKFYLWVIKGFSGYSDAAIAGQIIDNGHFTTDEEDENILDWHKKQYPWLFPDQAWTVVGKTNEDEDRATIANITSNGNDLVLSNFGFIEGSGYNEEGEYAGYLVTDGVDDKIVSSVFGMGKDFTIVGEWKFIIDENKGCGLVKVPKLFIYNSKTGLDIYINSNSIKNILSGIKGLNAVCSDGRVYDCNWNEISVKYGNMVDIDSSFLIANSGNIFTKMAFKNLGIYNNQLLSKDDCIKAYNYLQTLKAK